MGEDGEFGVLAADAVDLGAGAGLGVDEGEAKGEGVGAGRAGWVVAAGSGISEGLDLDTELALDDGAEA